MTYETYKYIFIASLVLAVIFLILSAVLFFVLRIKDVIGYLTGSSKKKALENKKNKKNASQKGTLQASAKKSTVNDEEGETAKISPQDMFDVIESTSSDTTMLAQENNEPIASMTIIDATSSETDNAVIYDGFNIVKEIEFVHSYEMIE